MIEFLEIALLCYAFVLVVFGFLLLFILLGG